MPPRSPLDKPKLRAQIIAWTVDGRSLREIRDLLAEQRVRTTHQAVSGFQKRHREEIEALTSEAVVRVEQHAVLEKSGRLAALAALYDRALAVVETRGLMARDVKWLGGEYGREVEVERFDAPLVREIRALLHDIAEERGDLTQRAPAAVLPTGEGAQVNILQVNIYGAAAAVAGPEIIEAEAKRK